jgi:hypothetical protein
MPHALVQDPQFAGSVARSTQAVPHLVRPLPHTHCAMLQIWSAAQAVLQLPQWLESLFGSTQLLPHRTSGLVQLVTHCPSWHACMLGHAVPQLPQFAGSVSALTHMPLQTVVVPGQTMPPSGRPASASALTSVRPTSTLSPWLISARASPSPTDISRTASLSRRSTCVSVVAASLRASTVVRSVLASVVGTSSSSPPQPTNALMTTMVARTANALAMPARVFIGSLIPFRG